MTAKRRRGAPHGSSGYSGGRYRSPKKKAYAQALRAYLNGYTSTAPKRPADLSHMAAQCVERAVFASYTEELLIQKGLLAP